MAVFVRELLTMDDDDRKPAALAQPKENYESESTSIDVKPALKRDRKERSKDKHLKWDEAAIDEHNELRGTRMKIDEPKTPYINYDSGCESDDSHRRKSPDNDRNTLSWDTLQNRLDTVAAVREQYPSSPSDHADNDHSDNELIDHDKEMRKLEFLEHRRRHYNEFELVKKFRSESKDEDDEDEEEDT